MRKKRALRVKRRKRMIKIENVETCNWRAAIRGMRNPMESWQKSDTDIGCDGKKCCECGFKPDWCGCTPKLIIGPNDLKLMKSLVNAGTDHSKFMRMITVSFDIVAPLYFWKEFDTYKIGVVRNSCSTMHKIEARPLVLNDFSKKGLEPADIEMLLSVILYINSLILEYKEATGEHKLQVHRRIVKLLPDSYLQRATITTNYQVLRSIRNSDRKTHKLLEWREDFMKFIDSLPYAKELLIEDDAYRYEKAKSFIERFDKEHGPLYKFLERADIVKPVDEEYNKALQGIKTYAKVRPNLLDRDSCAGLTCYSSEEDGSYTKCNALTHTYNAAECYHYFDCAKKGTGVAIPAKDIVNNTLVIEPGAFNGEEF